VSHISFERARTLSSSVPTQSGQTSSTTPNRPLLADPSNNSPTLLRKRKNKERLNLSTPGSKKRRVDKFDPRVLDGVEGPGLWRSITPHSFSTGNTDCQSNIESEHPPSAGRHSIRTVLAPPSTQEPLTPSSSTSVKQEIRSTFVASAPQTPMRGSHRPSRPPTPSTFHVVPPSIHRISGGNNLTLPVTQEASRSTSRRQESYRPSSSDPQNHPPRPPKRTPKNIPKTRGPLIDLCSSEDEGPVGGGQPGRTQAQSPSNGGPSPGEESDDNYWSICLSDDDREEPDHALDRVSKVQPTHIQRGWIPPVSSIAIALRDFPIDTVHLDFHRRSSSSQTI
jgi:hypothetical protein